MKLCDEQEIDGPTAGGKNRVDDVSLKVPIDEAPDDFSSMNGVELPSCKLDNNRLGSSIVSLPVVAPAFDFFFFFFVADIVVDVVGSVGTVSLDGENNDSNGAAVELLH